jgi:DNA-binding beta-propeller fold protein YncE
LSLVSERRDSRRLAVVFATITLAFVALLLFASRAQAVENIYWNNYSSDPDTLAFADITGSGGGALNLTGATLEGPEGMAYDSVTGRLYAASYENDQIVFANIDGSGGGVLNPAGAPVEEPMGLAIDPTTRTIYWTNTEGPGEVEGSIGWAKLDGSAGGQLNTSGATLDGPYRLGYDPVSGKVFWANSDPPVESIGFARTNNSGGGTLDLSGATPPESISGFAVDSAAGRLYWVTNSRVSFASINGGAGGDLPLAGGAFNGPYGLAFDPALNRLYWSNYSNGEERTNVFGFVNLGGAGGGISVPSAPVDGPQDPIIVKSPTGTGAPVVTRDAKVRSALACSAGSWGADAPGGYVYQAPRTLAYQWTQNGAAIPGATATTLTVTTPGSYACVVTAANPLGTAAQTSAGVNVKASKVKLSTKKKAKADPGDLVTFQVKIVNQGDLQSRKARICVKLPNAAKDDLRRPKCKKLAPVAGSAKRTAKFRVKVKPGADEGTDKLTFQVKGTPGKAAKSKIIVR